MAPLRLVTELLTEVCEGTLFNVEYDPWLLLLFNACNELAVTGIICSFSYYACMYSYCAYFDTN